MEEAIYYIAPFVKNLGTLCLTIFAIMLITAVIKAGFQNFSFPFWFGDNKPRFVTGLILVISLSILMAVTDVAPLFAVFGFNINASPVALGVALCALLGIISTTGTEPSRKMKTAQEIQGKANEIIEKSAAILKEEEETTTTKEKI